MSTQSARLAPAVPDPHVEEENPHRRNAVPLKKRKPRPHRCTEATCDRLFEGIRWGGVFHFTWRCSIDGKTKSGWEKIPESWYAAKRAASRYWGA